MKTLLSTSAGAILGAVLAWAYLSHAEAVCQAELVQQGEGHQIVVASLTEQLADATQRAAAIDAKWVAKVAHYETKYKAATEELGRIYGARVVIPEPKPMTHWEVTLAPVSALLGRWSPLAKGAR